MKYWVTTSVTKPFRLLVHLLRQWLWHWPMDLTYILVRYEIQVAGVSASDTLSQNVRLTVLSLRSRLSTSVSENSRNTHDDATNDHAHPSSTSESRTWCCKYAHLHSKTCKSKRHRYVDTSIRTKTEQKVKKCMLASKHTHTVRVFVHMCLYC